jgi:hypothetical protein
MNLFEAIFAHDPAAPAIDFSGREISYGELRVQTLRMAAAITSLEVQRVFARGNRRSHQHGAAARGAVFNPSQL